MILKYFENNKIQFCLIFLALAVIESSTVDCIEEVKNRIEKIDISTEQQQQPSLNDEIIIDDSLFDIKQDMEIDTKPDTDKLEPIAKPIDKVQVKIEEQHESNKVQVLDTKPCIDDKPIKIEDETVSALNKSTKDVPDENDDAKSTRRRSGRIKTINKHKQRAQGFGLVKDKKRTVNFGDEDLSNTSIEMINEMATDKEPMQPIEFIIKPKTKEELEQERIDRENGMKLFAQIMDNEYRSERTISKEAKKMTCDCFLTQSEMERGELGCGDDCLNRMLLIECSPKCIVGERCTNRRFQKHQNADCTIFKTAKKGYGLIATSYIPAGVFIMEYVGEVLNSKQFEKRASDYSKQMNAHYYFMALSSDCVIDATKKGNISRFINHSCDPNAETQKWTVNGELRIGFFSKKPIMQDEEITFDYQFQRYG